MNCGWTSDSQFTPAEEPASKEAAIAWPESCRLFTSATAFAVGIINRSEEVVL